MLGYRVTASYYLNDFMITKHTACVYEHSHQRNINVCNILWLRELITSKLNIVISVSHIKCLPLRWGEICIRLIKHFLWGNLFCIIILRQFKYFVHYELFHMEINSSIYKSFIYPSIHPSIFLLIHSSTFPFIHLSIHSFIYLSIRPSIHPYIKHLFIHPYISLSIHPSIHSSFIYPFIHPSIH